MSDIESNVKYIIYSLWLYLLPYITLSDACFRFYVSVLFYDKDQIHNSDINVWGLPKTCLFLFFSTKMKSQIIRLSNLWEMNFQLRNNLCLKMTFKIRVLRNNYKFICFLTLVLCCLPMFSFKNWMLILVLLCENECQRWDASRCIKARSEAQRFYVYRDASHLWHSFSHNRTKINIQNL